MSIDWVTGSGSQTPISMQFYLKWEAAEFCLQCKIHGRSGLWWGGTATGLPSPPITLSLSCLGFFQQSLLCARTISSAMVLHVMLKAASKTFRVLGVHSGSVLDSVRCLNTWFVGQTCIVLKNVLNHNFGMRAELNWGHFAGSLPLRSLSQCFKVGDCATIILYCSFYAKVSLSFYIPLKSEAILEHLILFNLFTLAA